MVEVLMAEASSGVDVDYIAAEFDVDKTPRQHDLPSHLRVGIIKSRLARRAQNAEPSETDLYGFEYDKAAASFSDQAFIGYIKELPLLTAGEEAELAQCIEQGDQEAKELLVTHNLRLVASIAKGYCGLGSGTPTMAELIQEGALGAAMAADRFDYRRGLKFSTFATDWISRTILEALQKTGRPIKLSVPLNKKASKISQAEKLYEQEHGKVPSTKEIAVLTGVKHEDVLLIKEVTTPPVSLDKPHGGDENCTLENTIGANQSYFETDEEPEEELHSSTKEGLSKLPQKNRLAIRSHHGIGLDGREKSLSEVAHEMGITKGSAGHLINRGHALLKAYVQEPGTLGV